MQSFIKYIYAVIATLGGFGLLIVGILDSSFLVMPLGNDLLVIALTARKNVLLPYYAAMATAGSVLGVLLLDLVFRTGGEKSLDRHVEKKRLDYLKERINRRAGPALALATMAPPPFPFTPVVAVASALQYPRKKLLSIIAVFRFIRFSLEGVLAIVFGKRILSWADSPFVYWGVVVMIVIALGGSTLSILRWIQRSKKVEAGTDNHARPAAARTEPGKAA